MTPVCTVWRASSFQACIMRRALCGRITDVLGHGWHDQIVIADGSKPRCHRKRQAWEIQSDVMEAAHIWSNLSSLWSRPSWILTSSLLRLDLNAHNHFRKTFGSTFTLGHASFFQQAMLHIPFLPSPLPQLRMFVWCPSDVFHYSSSESGGSEQRAESGKQQSETQSSLGAPS